MKYLLLLILFFGCVEEQDEKIEKWKDGVIYYTYEDKSDMEEYILNKIKEVTKSWEKGTPLLFVEIEKKESAHYEYIYTIYRDREQNISFSDLGQKKGKLVLASTTEWISTSTLSHEFGHCIGLTHEHNRPDRDLYIKINWENIQSNCSRFFDIEENPFYDVTKIEYDYNSIMHYQEKTFIKKSLIYTDEIVIDSSKQIKEPRELFPTKRDLKKVNLIYKS